MKSYLPHNRNPRAYRYVHLDTALREDGEPGEGGRLTIKLGKNTLGTVGDSDGVLCVEFDGRVIIHLYDNGTVRLMDHGVKDKMTKARMDAAMQGICHRLVTVKRKWKIYEIATGKFTDYFNGIVVSE